MTTTTYRVTGMTCGHCVAAVTEELTALDGVTDVSVDLVAGGTSDVIVTSEAALDDATVAEAVDEAGYAVAGPRDLPLA
jgi:copper chaperone CopZ